MSEMQTQSKQQKDDATGTPAAKPQLHGMAKWVHEHRDATTKPVGHIGYQMIRNMLAGIPYGIATIGVWSGFERLDRFADAKVRAGKNTYFFDGVKKLAKSPFKDIMMIAAGFTLYRGTLKMVKYAKERLFNPNNTEEDTKREVDNFGANLVKDFKEIAPAEVNSTPYGAIALGMGRRYLNGIKPYGERPPEHSIAPRTLDNHVKDGGKLFPGSVFKNGDKWSFGKENWKAFTNKVFHPKSMPWAEAGVFTAAFLAFFELSDRLFKDVQIRRGVWHGEHNSLARVDPQKAEVIDAKEKEQGLDKDAKHQLEKHGAGKHTNLYDGEPNMGRMFMTRILSTALGIGAYTFTKRAAYATMGHFTSAPTFWQKAFIEGAATSTFFVMTTSNDVIDGLYNKYVVKPKEHKTPVQQQKHDELLTKLNEKYKANGVAA